MSARRGKGEGSISSKPRKDGRWFGSLDLGYVAGKRRRMAFYGKTRREVADKLSEAIVLQRRGQLAAPDRITLEHYVKGWLDARRNDLAPTTWDSYESALRMNVLPALGSKRLSRVTPEDLQGVYEQMRQRGGAASTIARLHGILHAAFKDAIGKHIAVNPCDRARHPRPNAVPRRTLTRAEVARVLDVVRDSRDEALFVLAFATGMRRGELMGLRWRDVDFERSAIHLQAAMTSYHGLKRPKSGRGRLIPLPPSALDALRRHQLRQAEERLAAGPAWDDSDLVLTTRRGHSLYRHSLRRWRAVMRGAGAPPIRLHDARHTAATIMLLEGVTLRQVAAVLGHSDPATTARIYEHVTPETEDRAIRVMEWLVGPSNGSSLAVRNAESESESRA